MKNKKLLGTFGIVLAVVLVFIIVWAVVSGQNSDLAASSDIAELTQPQSSPLVSPSTQSNNTVSQSGDATSPSQAAPAANQTKTLSKFLHEQEDILADMFEDMREEGPSGNASEDFLEGMIPHHEAAIDLAKNYLKYGGTNPSLAKMAGEIITTRTSELQQMELLEDEIEDLNIRDEAKEEEFLTTYRSILSSHSADAYPPAEDVEHAFARQMISHEQMAVDMAKSILSITDHEQVRKLAETIIKTEENEIGQMKELVNAG